MNRAEKEAFVSTIKDGIDGSQAFALMSFSKLTVEQMTDLRLSLRKKDVRVRVIKNTLARRAFSGSVYSDLTTHLAGPTMLAYSSADPIVAAKAIWEWADRSDIGVSVKGGAALGQMMSEAQLKALSMLPGRNELYVSFLWALKSAPTKFLYALQDAPRRLGYALNALKEKRENQSA